MDKSLTLVDMSGSTKASASFGINIFGLLSLRGSLSVTPILVARLIGKLCFTDYLIEAGFDFEIGLQGSFSLEGSIASVIKGGVSVGGTVVHLGLNPRSVFDVKVGLEAELPIKIRAINLAIKAFRQNPVPKFCKKSGIKYFCGFKWGGRRESTFGTIGININQPAISFKFLIPDPTPPLIDKVRLEQLSPSEFKVDWGSVTEEETRVGELKLTVSNVLVVEPLRSVEPSVTDTSWEGAFSTDEVRHGASLRACLRATNVFGTSTLKCSDPVRWDSASPSVSAFYTTNPFTGSLRLPPEWCRQELNRTGTFPVESCPIYHNDTVALRFAVRLADNPSSAPLRSAVYALSTNHPCVRGAASSSSRDCESATLATEFHPIGHTKRLAAGSTACPGSECILEVMATDLKLTNGVRYYVNFYLCDVVGNCAMQSSAYPVTIDATPPLLPSRVFADRNVNTSADGLHQFFVNRTRISAVWTPPVASDSVIFPISTGTVLEDEESGMREAYIDLYRLLPATAEGKEFVGKYPLANASNAVKAARRQFAPYVQAKLDGPDGRAPALLLGEAYVLELVLINSAGGISSMVSPVIVADWTPPVCTTPRLFPGEHDRMVQAFVQPPGSTHYMGTRVHNWIRGDAADITVYISEGTCIDDESGIRGVEMWVSNEPNDREPFITPPRLVEPGFSFPLSISPKLDFEDRTECDQCGSAIFVGIRCHNGANMRDICPHFGSIRVDGSPPVCIDGQVVLGQGSTPEFQAHTNGFNVSNFDFGLEDRETGIENVTYELLDEESLYGSLLSPPIRLTWADHAGLPVGQMTILGDGAPELSEPTGAPVGFTLVHGHRYRVRYTPTNMLGMVGEPCYTSSVLIDTTPPLKGVVVILQHDSDNDAAIPEPNYYQYSQRVVRVAARNFADPESDIRGYGVSVYRTDGFVLLPEVWVGLQDFVTIDVYLEDKRSFYVNWAAYNQADLVSVVKSPNVVVDATKPIIEYIRDVFRPGIQTLGGSEVDVIAVTDVEVGCLFSTHDDESGIRDASWCLGPLP